MNLFSHEVKLGIDRLQNPEILKSLEGKRIGMLIHRASINSEGKHLIDLVSESELLKGSLIFTPEHGLRGEGDDFMEDGVDQKSKLPYYSLYTKKRKGPLKEHLDKIDVLLVDLQDVGVRYYTYVSTLSLVLEKISSFKSKVKVIVLDRPNPIGGEVVSGPILSESLIGPLMAYLPIPFQHGMTIGELGEYIVQLKKLEVDYSVVKMKGWHRQMKWSDTSLLWTASSPALPSILQVELYSLFGLFESFNLAVGRGVTNGMAFKIYGAPWIEGHQASALVEKLNSLNLFGLKFFSVSWIPTRREYLGQNCHGLRVEYDSTIHLSNPFKITWEVASTLIQFFGDKLRFKRTTPLMIGDDLVFRALGTQSFSFARSLYGDQLSKFKSERQRFLIYPN